MTETYNNDPEIESEERRRAETEAESPEAEGGHAASANTGSGEDAISVLASYAYGYLFMQSKNSVGLGGWVVSKVLGDFYEQGYRYATAVIELPGKRRLVLSGRIYRRESKWSEYYWLRPRGLEQKILRMLLEKYRRDSFPRAKKTYPVILLFMMPALMEVKYINGEVHAFEVPPED
jgi:hypothetical protein